MYLFTRVAQAAPGKLIEAYTWAAETAAVAADSGGVPIATWGSIFSPEVGGLSWSMRVESIAQLHEANAKSLASTAFHEAANKGVDLLIGPPADALLEIVVASGLGDAPPAFATVVQAVGAPGQLLDAYAAGVEIANLFHSLTGQSAIFLRNVTGAFGGVSWITGAPSAAAIDEANATLAASADWPVLVNKAGMHFGGDTTTRMLQRLA